MAVYLVTGGAGFIGSNLCDRLLTEGHKVVAVDDLTMGRIANLAEARSRGGGFTFEHVDIRSEGLRAVFDRHRPEVVMHLAAQISVRQAVEDPINDASVNLIGLLHVLRCAVAVGTRKVVFASSGGTIYGEPRKLPVAETARRGSRPDSPYGISKKAAELYLEWFRRQHGLDYAALALANVYGPRQDPNGEGGVVAIFGSAMLEGRQPTVFGDGQQTRDYVYVDDVVHAFALAADRGSHDLLNVGTGVETSVNDLFKRMAKIAGYRGDPAHAEARAGEARRSALDPSRAERVLGWRAWTPLDRGLTATVAWLQSGLPGERWSSQAGRSARASGATTADPPR
jgi:UDP-glucose 4-epimerase